jgi:hypothetical protein
MRAVIFEAVGLSFELTFELVAGALCGLALAGGG